MALPPRPPQSPACQGTALGFVSLTGFRGGAPLTPRRVEARWPGPSPPDLPAQSSFPATAVTRATGNRKHELWALGTGPFPVPEDLTAYSRSRSEGGLGPGSQPHCDAMLGGQRRALPSCTFSLQSKGRATRSFRVVLMPTVGAAAHPHPLFVQCPPSLCLYTRHSCSLGSVFLTGNGRGWIS